MKSEQPQLAPTIVFVRTVLNLALAIKVHLHVLVVDYAGWWFGYSNS
jgi:hypothetical protein